MNGIPVIPMHRILSQYVAAKKLPFRLNRWEEFMRAYKHYTTYAQFNN